MSNIFQGAALNKNKNTKILILTWIVHSCSRLPDGMIYKYREEKKGLFQNLHTMKFVA